jgi:hypothetical protein
MSYTIIPTTDLAGLISLLSHSVIIIWSLLEEEVGSKLLVLVASEIGLSSLFAVEAQPTQALDGVTLLLGHLDRIRSGRERRVIVTATLA